MIPKNHDECADTPSITQAPGLTSFGTYNMLPEPAMEIPADVFTNHITVKTIVGIEARQPRDLSYTSLKIFWLGTNNGVGVSRQWCDGTWTNAYWFFGCNHIWVEQEPAQYERDLVGSHTHVYICKRCNHRMIVDSSG